MATQVPAPESPEASSMPPRSTASPALRAAAGYAARCIRIDTRSLAVFRILAGSLIILDLVLRAGRFSFLYTNDGVVPRDLAISASPDGAFSFYYLSTETWFIAALFVVQGLIAVQLIAGYKTTVAVILSFLFVVSLDHHNPLVLSYADLLFRLLLFWAIFLPLGERWSIDAVHAARAPRPYVASIASGAILVQMIYMYVVNWYHKSTNELWTSGEATVLIFGLDDTTFLLGDAMRNMPTMLQYGGLLWYYMLMLSPLLLLLQGRARIFAAALFIGGHASFAITVRIGAFPYVGIAGVLLFLQAQFWDDAQRLVQRARLNQRRDAAYARVERLGHALAARLPGQWLRLPRPIATIGSDLSAIAVIAILVIPGLSLLHQAELLAVDPGDIESEIGDIAAMIGVRQPPWSVFAPNPRRIDRYHVFVAETAGGELLDIYNDRPFTFDRPYDQLQRQYASYRERFYMNSVRRAGFDGRIAPTLAEYLCNEWRQARGIEITNIEMYVISETVTVDTIANPEERATQRTLFYRHGCGNRAPREIALPSG